jgi:hypothetical protein
MQFIQETHDSAMEGYEQQAKETENALKLEMVIEVNKFKKKYIDTIHDYNDAIQIERVQNSELRHANLELKRNSLIPQICVVCMEDEERSSYVFSCGHCCVCDKCAPNVAKECPLCRTVGSCNKLLVS